MYNNKDSTMVLCYLCSIVDESTKSERKIANDSPAATNKVLAICNALQTRLNHVYVISTGRGRQTGSGEKFVSTAKRVSSVPVIFASFWHVPLMTHAITSISLVCILFRLMGKHKSRNIHLIAYNRRAHYYLVLFVARIFGVKCYLDLEDGALVRTGSMLHKLGYSIGRRFFDFLCSSGALLASSALSAQVSQSHRVVCHGVVQKESDVLETDWKQVPLRMLFGGSLLKDTGVQLLIDAVRFLESDHKSISQKIVIVVTGYGLMSEELLKFSKEEGSSWLEYYGRVDKSTYDQLLADSHVGLCLKLPSSEMCATTFPSKVVEYASYGKAVLTTNIGDVYDFFGSDGAYYLPDESPASLARAIQSFVEDPQNVENIALKGQTRALAHSGKSQVASDIIDLLKKKSS